MIQSEQVTVFMGQRGFEIISAGCGIGGELQHSAVLQIRVGIENDVGLADFPRFRIVENARARGGFCFTENSEVLIRSRNRNQTDAVATPDRTYRLCFRSDFNKRDV